MKQVIILLLLIFLASPVLAWEIEDFHLDMFVRKDGSFHLQEKIVVDFDGERHHGIYREIPVKYTEYGTVYKVRLSDIKVYNEEHKPRRVKVTRRGRMLNIRIGNPKLYVTGKQTYIIDYVVRRAVNFKRDGVEIYWNLTGNEWRAPIRHFSANVYFFEGSGFDVSRVHCYTGPAGSKSELGIIPTDTGFSVETSNVYPSSGVTFITLLPSGSIKKPPATQALGYFFADNWFLFIPVLVFIVMFCIWKRYGVDVGRELAVMPEYEPPDGLTPAEVGTIIDERVDVADISATIIDLAVRGYIRITEANSKKLIFFSKKDYLLTQMREPDEGLKPFERKLMRSLFSRKYRLKAVPLDGIEVPLDVLDEIKGKPTVSISGLKNKFYKDLDSLKKQLYRTLTKDKYFVSNPEKVRNKWRILGFMVMFVGFFFVGPLGGTIGLFGPISILVSGAIVLIFSGFMPRKTRKGVFAARHIAGFKEFIERVEKDRIRRMATDDPTVFERLLPFAMALGVADEWAEVFEGIEVQRPNWYCGYGAHFSTHAFVSNLGGAVSGIGNAISSRPSGSSSGGGGGFSGGGFGGGGGGAW